MQSDWPTDRHDPGIESSEGFVDATKDGDAPTGAAPQNSLDPNFIPADRIAGWIIAGILGSAWAVTVALLLIFVGDDFSNLARLIVIGGGGALVVALCIFVHVWPPIDYRHRTYSISNKGIQICKGVVWRSVIDVPHSRVQHTDVNQGPIERKYGLGHLVIHTAGTMSATVKLEGLKYETALALRDQLVGGEDDDSV